ncbi:MAG: hypothetical protein ACOYY3_19955 [Chloroflexota bacterium]
MPSLPALLKKYATPLVFFALSLAAYGVFAFQQNFHWDDWGFAWLIRTLGRPGLFDYFATNRPFLAYVYSLTTPVFGVTPWAWQLFAIFWQTLAGIALWWVLRRLWPGHDRPIFWVVALFLVYPGFDQHNIAITYGHFFIALTVFFVSLGLAFTFAAAPRQKWWAGVLSLLLTAMHLFMTEYFFGLELLRLVFLWLFLRHDLPEWKSRLRRAALIYLPFLAVLGGYLYWRVFVLGFYLYQPELVSPDTSLLDKLAAIPATLWEQFTVAGPEAWAQVFRLPDFAAYGPRLTLVYWLLLLAGGYGLYGFGTRLRKSTEARPGFEAAQKDFRSLEWLILGLLAMLAAGAPFIITGLPLRLDFPNSRFTLPFALGSALVLVALIELLPRRLDKNLLAAGLTLLAVGAQFDNGFLYRADSKLQEAFFWQMTWRMPGLQKDTILLSSDTPFGFSSDSSLTMPLNWTYSPDNFTTQMDYAYFFVSVRLGHELEAIEPGLSIHQDYLAATFDSSSSAIVAVTYNPPGCFRALHPVYDADLPLAPSQGADAESMTGSGLPVLPRTAAQSLALSNLNRILPDPPVVSVPPSILGPEPAHRWCYYFEKADLARQQEDWAGVADIGDEVFAIPFYPDDPSEYLPFVEAYARTGRWPEARDLTRKTADLMPMLRPALCAVWQRVETQAPGALASDQIEKMKTELGYCPYP